MPVPASVGDRAESARSGGIGQIAVAVAAGARELRKCARAPSARSAPCRRLSWGHTSGREKWHAKVVSVLRTPSPT
jgi:hypothetical protein